MEMSEKISSIYLKNKHKITKYFRDNNEDLWFLGAILSSFLFILIKFGLLYTLPLFTFICCLKCRLIYISKRKGGDE